MAIAHTWKSAPAKYESGSYKMEEEQREKRRKHFRELGNRLDAVEKMRQRERGEFRPGGRCDILHIQSQRRGGRGVIRRWKALERMACTSGISARNKLSAAASAVPTYGVES